MNGTTRTKRLFARGWGVGLACLVAGAVVLFGGPARAQQPGRYVIELRVIEGVPGGGDGRPQVDPKLAAFAKDLKGLPFKSFKLIDSHTTAIREGERVSLEIPPHRDGKKTKKRFLQVAARGRQPNGKLRFQLGIEVMDFDTLVKVPDGGTIIVAVPKQKEKALLFAFTARSQR